MSIYNILYLYIHLTFNVLVHENNNTNLYFTPVVINVTQN